VRVRVFCAETVTGMVNVRVKPLPLTFTERLYVPPAIEMMLETLRATVDPGVNVAAANWALMPEGAPLRVTASGPLNVPVGELHDNCAEADNPALKARLAGLLASAQVGKGVTTRVTGTVLLIPPPLAETVRG
jgi:hypothetical protein